MYHSSWLSSVYDPKKLRETVYLVSCEIEKLYPKPKFIAVRGVSGVSVGAAVSYYTSIPLVVVRKDSERTHSSGTVQGISGLCGDYVIVDDLIDSGATIRTMQQELKDDNSENNLLAIILYSQRYYSDGLKARDRFVPVIFAGKGDQE